MELSVRTLAGEFLAERHADEQQRQALEEWDKAVQVNRPLTDNPAYVDAFKRLQAMRAAAADTFGDRPPNGGMSRRCSATTGRSATARVPTRPRPPSSSRPR